MYTCLSTSVKYNKNEDIIHTVVLLLIPFSYYWWSKSWLENAFILEENWLMMLFLLPVQVKVRLKCNDLLLVSCNKQYKQ